MLGFCAVMQCQVRPDAVIKVATEIVPAILVQLDGLKDSYESKGSIRIYSMKLWYNTRKFKSRQKLDYWNLSYLSQITVVHPLEH